MPSKLTNILSVGRPAIATAGEGTALWDVLEGASAGTVVPPDDLERLVTAMRRLTDAPELRAAMGLAARGYAERFLDADVILAAFESDLESVI